MSVAVARIEQRIVFSGKDQTKPAIESAASGLRKVELQALRSTGALKDVGNIDSTKVREVSGDLESAFKGISDFSGAAERKVSELGDAFGSIEATARLIPGPIGLTVAGLSLAVLSAKLLTDYLNESNALLANVATEQGREFAKALDLSADGASKLSIALERIPQDARPSVLVLEQVKRAAELVGQDGEEAVQRFTEAWADGPAAVKAMTAEIGLVTLATETAVEAAARLRIDPKTTGLTETLSATDRLNAGLTASTQAAANLAAQQLKIATLETEAGAATVRRKLAIQDQLVVERERLDQLKSESELADYTAQRRARVVELDRAAGIAVKEVGQIRSESEALAALAQDKSAAAGIKLEGIDEQRALLMTQLLAIQKELTTSNAQELQDRERGLTLQVQQLAAQRAAVVEAEKERRKQELARAAQRAEQAAAKARQRSDAELASVIRLQQAQLALAGTESERYSRQLGLIALQEQADLRAARNAVNTAKGRADAIRAIELDAAAKRLELQRKTEDELAETITKSQDRSKALALSAADAETVAAQTARSGKIGALRESGKEEQALQIEQQAVRDDFAKKAAAIEAKRQADSATVVAGSEDAVAIQRTADAELLALQEETLAKEAEIRKRREQAQRDATTKFKAELAENAAMVNKAASFGSGTIAGGAQRLTAAFGAVAGSWKSLKESAPGAISAAGDVAMGFIKGKKAQAAAGALFETAAGFASIGAGDPKGAAAHFISAALYGAMAGGLIGTAGGGGGGGNIPTAGGGGGTGNTFSGGFTPGGQEGTAGNIYISVNRPLSTEAEVGRDTRRAIRAAERAGFARQRGA